jgi:hypothetical protein
LNHSCVDLPDLSEDCQVNYPRECDYLHSLDDALKVEIASFQIKCAEYQYPQNIKCGSCFVEGDISGLLRCTSCVNGYELLDFTCVCSSGFYQTGAKTFESSMCLPCHNSCTSCTGPGPEDCTMCSLRRKQTQSDSPGVACSNVCTSDFMFSPYSGMCVDISSKGIGQSLDHDATASNNFGFYFDEGENFRKCHPS